MGVVNEIPLAAITLFVVECNGEVIIVLNGWVDSRSIREELG